jgi:hypothetical protein
MTVSRFVFVYVCSELLASDSVTNINNSEVILVHISVNYCNLLSELQWLDGSKISCKEY